MSDTVSTRPEAAVPASGAAAMFTRKTSGLVREYSLTDVTLMNLAGQSLGVGVALSVFTAAEIWPGANVAILIVLAAILSLVTAIVYGLMSAAMPRSGGDYVFVGRTLHPMIGFTANLLITVSLFIALGLYSDLIVVYGLSNGLSALGLITGSHWIATAGATLSTTKSWIFVWALIFMLVSLYLGFRSAKLVRWSFRVLFVIGMIGVIAMAIVLLTTSRADFSHSLARYLGSNDSLAAIHKTAVGAGFKHVPFSWSQTLKALPFGFFLFVGVTYTTYIGGEVKRPQRSQPMGMLFAILIGGATELILIIGLYAMVGWNNIHAIAYLTVNAPTKLALPTAPLASFFASIAGSNTVLAVLIGLGFIAWWLILLLFVVILPSRNLFAYAFDRLMPMALTKVTRNGAPWVSNLVVGILAIGVIVLTIFTNVVNLIVNYTLMISITFAVAGIAAAVFPWRRPDLFERAPGIVRTRILGVPLVAIGGVLQAVLFIYIVYESYKTPAFSGPVGTGAKIFILAVIAAGPVIYYGAQWYRKRENIDIGLMYKELPPD